MPEKVKDLVQKVEQDQEEDEEILNEKFESQHLKGNKDKNNMQSGNEINVNNDLVNQLNMK
jgi:hypothetical protein